MWSVNHTTICALGCDISCTSGFFVLRTVQERSAGPQKCQDLSFTKAKLMAVLAEFAELSCSGLRYWTDRTASCLPTNVSVGKSCKTLNYIQRQL